MRHPTIKVPLFRQPPVYMVLAVVLVSLVPLALQLWGTRPLDPAPSAPPVLTARAVMSGVTLDGLRPTCEPATAEDLEFEALEQAEIPELAEEPLAMAMELQDEDDAEVVIIEDVSEPESQPSPRRTRSSRGLLGKAKRAYAKGKPKAAYQLAGDSARKRPTKGARVVQAKAACKLRNKGAARSAYRQLPLGSQRREVRRSCREHGILLL